MQRPCIDYNVVEMVGKLVNNFSFLEKRGEKELYSAVLLVKRGDSGRYDHVNLVVDYESIANIKVDAERRLAIKGFVYGRTVNNRMKTGVFVEEIELVDDSTPYKNLIKISGEIASKVTYRYKERELTDFILASTSRGCTQYIPIITWGGQAVDIAKNFIMGDAIRLKGRLQCRTYRKNVDGATVSYKTYEVCVRKYKKGRKPE